MPTDWTLQIIDDTYKDLIHISNDNQGIDTTLRIIYDGVGNASPLKIATDSIALGSFEFNTSQSVGAGQDDYVLTYDHSTGKINLEAASGGGSVAFDDLTDVTISTPSSGHFVVYNGSNWANTAVNLSGINDVTISSITSGEVLKWNGSAWINNTLAEAGIAAASHTHATSSITSGTFDDARIAESNVTQHETALTITESQISDLGSYLTTSVGSYLDFSTSSNPAHSEQRLFYDATNNTFAFYNDESDITHQIGMESWIRVYNNSGGTISNGEVVYVTGQEATEDRLTVGKAIASAASTSRVIGLATHDIEDNSYGYVTQFGDVNDLDLSAFTDGDPVWLSSDTAGALTSTEPVSPNRSVFIGYVASNDASTGRLFVTTIGNTGSVQAGAATELLIPVRKGSAGTITKGQAIYISGYNVGQSVVEVELADADSSSTMPAIGLANDNITNSTNSTAIVSGRLAGVDTSSFSVGDEIYVSGTAGGLTTTKPVGASLIQKVGIIARSNASNGVIEVIGAGRANDVPNFSSADKYWYGGTSGVVTEGDITSAGRALLDDADASAQRTTLGLGTAATAASTDFLSVTGDTGTGSYNIIGDLDVDNININGNTITSTDTNGNIVLTPDGTGNIVLGAFTFDADQSVGAGQDNYVLTYDNGTGLISLEASAGGGLSNVVEDTTPQLGGQLDVNGNAIGDGTRELITFTEDASAVNHVNIENEATGSGPIISAAGDDTNVDLNINAKGTGNVAIGNFTFDADQTVGAGQDNYVLTYDNAGGLISLEAASGGSSGKVLQVISTTKTDSYSASISSATTITGLTASITPSSTSSKILVMWHVNYALSTAFNGAALLIDRGGTPICLGDSAGSRSQSTHNLDAESNDLQQMIASGNYLDSPSTTSSITYSVQFDDTATANTMYCNRSQTDTDTAGSHRTASTITLMEIDGT